MAIHWMYPERCLCLSRSDAGYALETKWLKKPTSQEEERYLRDHPVIERGPANGQIRALGTCRITLTEKTELVDLGKHLPQEPGIVAIRAGEHKFDILQIEFDGRVEEVSVLSGTTLGVASFALERMIGKQRAPELVT